MSVKNKPNNLPENSENLLNKKFSTCINAYTKLGFFPTLSTDDFLKENPLKEKLSRTDSIPTIEEAFPGADGDSLWYNGCWLAWANAWWVSMAAEKMPTEEDNQPDESEISTFCR